MTQRNTSESRVSPCHAIEQNELDVYRAASIAAGSAFVQGEGVSWVNNRPYWPSYLVSPTFAPHQIDSIRQLGERIEAREIPTFMKIGPSSWSEELGATLERGGFVKTERRESGMAINLDTLPDHAPTPGFEVETVRDEETAHRWASVGFHVSPSMFARLAYDPRVTLLMGSVGGAPVATSMVFAQNGIGGLYLVFVKEAWRRQGLGSAITRAAFGDARRRGCEYAVLGASTNGEPMYRRIGLVECFRYHFYRWHNCTFDEWIKD